MSLGPTWFTEISKIARTIWRNLVSKIKKNLSINGRKIHTLIYALCFSDPSNFSIIHIFTYNKPLSLVTIFVTED